VYVAVPVNKFRGRKDGKQSSQDRRNVNVTSDGYIGTEKWGKITAFKSRVPLCTSKKLSATANGDKSHPNNDESLFDTKLFCSLAIDTPVQADM
jgi:hypothetical protein